MYEPAWPLWQKATDLLVPLYGLTKQFPKDEIAVRISQLRSTAVGIALNLAEGLNCDDPLDVRRFLDQALQSARDCVEELEIANRLDLWPQKQVEAVRSQAEEVARLLTGALNNLSLSKG